MDPLKLCILSSEIVPFAKTGGLADVVGTLVREFSSRGHDVRAFMPLYASVKRTLGRSKPVAGLADVAIAVGSRTYSFSVRCASIPGTAIPIHFVDCPELFDRPAIYTQDPDEHRRFVLFTRAVLESCLRVGFAPDIFHCHDWHTAFLPLYLTTVYAPLPLYNRSRSVLTIHNIGYQGLMSRDFVDDLGLGAAVSALDQADLGFGVINPLKTGIRHAHTVTTVSPTYAREISDGPLGMGMQDALRERTRPVVGILNGVDYLEWDPRHDPHLTAHFSTEDLEGKRANKRMLLKTARLAVAEEIPLVGMVTRLAAQKGIDLLMGALPRVLGARECGLVVLGSGDARYEGFFESLARSHAGRVAYFTGFDERLAHLIEAGSDMFLMPSNYEPCGLNQMYSQRYGTIPIVRDTGGLADTVQHYDPATGVGTGCVFRHYDAPAVEWALNTTLDWFADRAGWRKLMRNAMERDFSWARQVDLYENMFRETAAQSAGSSKA